MQIIKEKLQFEECLKQRLGFICELLQKALDKGIDLASMGKSFIANENFIKN